MKYLVVIIAVLVFPLSAFAQAAFSANGFKCNKNNNTVFCEGQFPGVKGTFGAVGTYSVTIKYELNGRDYQYDSLEGCLLVGDQKKQELHITNRKGKSATFKSLKKALSFCKVSK